MIDKIHKHQPEQIIALWEYNNAETGNLYKSEARVPLIEDLCALMKADNYDYEDVMRLKSRVIDFLVTEKGKKLSNKKDHPYYKWLPNAEKDFDRAAAAFFIDRSALEDNFYGNQFLSKKPEIESWVQETFGTQDERLVKETHRFFSNLMVRWVQETLMK